MNLILLDPGEVDGEGRVELFDGRAVHAQTVLKVAPGSEIRVGLLDGPRGVAAVEAVAGGAVVLRCRFEAAAPERPAVDLLLALPRPKVMRRLWAQVAALGVGQIILTNAARVERQYFDTHVLAPDSYAPLLIEGLQQARDTRVPPVSIHRRFKVLIEDDLDALSDAGIRLMAHPSAATAGAILAARMPSRVLLAIGPEGGWNAFERDLLAAHGFTAVGMGPRTLRTDTACIALLAVVHEAIAAAERVNAASR
jgi:RsmE family RNA methyltransferase